MGKFHDMKLSNFGSAVVLVAGRLYVKTEEAMRQLIGEVEAIGYKVEKSEHGTNSWFASLQDVRKGKCGSCNELIAIEGIQSHGHQCEKCGAVTYWKIIDGTEVRFSFIERDEGKESPMLIDLKMIAKRWETGAGYVYFYPQVEGGLWTSDDRAKAYFEANSDKWEEVEEGGEKLIKMRHTQPWDRKVCAYNPSEIRGPYGKTHNHSIVKVWDGKVYSEWSDDFPLPDSISLYGTWHKDRLPASPTIHRAILHAAGQTDDKGWHYQDGRPWFVDGHWQNMSMFIRHFTELDADEFDKAWPRFRKDGPGGIDDLAAWCHPDAVARNDPNIGNMLVGLSKVAGGQRLTSGEVAAMKLAAEDRGIMNDVTRLINGRR
jgi:hypothetical protein